MPDSAFTGLKLPTHFEKPDFDVILEKHFQALGEGGVEKRKVEAQSNLANADNLTPPTTSWPLLDGVLCARSMHRTVIRMSASVHHTLKAHLLQLYPKALHNLP